MKEIPAMQPQANRVARWRLGLGAAAVLFLGSAPSALANFVAITSVNGEYNQDKLESLDVKPGDLVQLSADVYTETGDGGSMALNQAVEDFVWQGDDRSGDECDASQTSDCLSSSNFQL